MREIVDEVLAAEKKAEELLQESKDKAAELRRQAETEVSERVKKAREDGRALIRGRAEAAEQTTQQSYRERMEEVRRMGHDRLAQNQQDMEAVVQDLVKLIVEPQQDRR